jgi:hypothetical protein
MTTSVFGILITSGSLFIAGIIWFVRLESKVLYLAEKVETNKESVDENKDKMWEKIDDLIKVMNDVKEGLARLEGTLNIKPNNQP